MYDYIVVGAGLFGAVFSYEATKKGKKCLVVDRRSHIGGNVYTERIEGINVHKYGAHIFHTNDEKIWKYINKFADFNCYINSPLARYKKEIYNLPFNMNTFNKMWGVVDPSEAKEKIREQVLNADIGSPKNLEEQAISMVGYDVYEKLIKGYTAKQWGKPCNELPPFIIKRLPVRYTYDNNYFFDKYQGIPIGGYTNIIKKMLENVNVKLNVDFLKDRSLFKNLAPKIIYTGMIDEYYNYCFGKLDYRSLHFETELLDLDNYQGNAVVNYTEYEIPFTRIIEHKHFEFGEQPNTVITREYPRTWKRGDDPYYPVNDLYNNSVYLNYKDLSENDEDVFFGGRLGKYTYYDMHQVVSAALDLHNKIFADNF